MKNNQSVCLVVPTYNEKDNLPLFISAVAKLGLPNWQMIIIDDNSPDGTGQLADQLADQYPIKVIHREKKLGLGSAYRQGFQAALNTPADFIVQMDADLSHDPKDIPGLLNQLSDHDVAVGSRYISGGGSTNWSKDRKFISSWANRLTRILLRSRLHDLTSGFKAYTHSALNQLHLTDTSSQGYNFQIETSILLEKQGLKIIEVPIIFTERKIGKSKFNLPIILECAVKVLKQAVKINFTLLLLSVILIAASLLRLLYLTRADVISDEVFYGFRAIGLLDFDFAASQPSPVQLFTGDIPGWTKLSFHDHPILVFLVQHISYLIFGVSTWAMRLPSALFGIGSVFLTYLIGKKSFSKQVGLIAAAILSVNVLMLYVSRIGVQESQVIFLCLLAVYSFIRAMESTRWFALWGLSWGLALLSKYTALYLFLPFTFYLSAHRAVASWAILFQKKYFKSWHLYLGSSILLICLLPIIIYNILLYQTFGHFDFQIFYLFGQKVSYWQVAPGKEIGGFISRLTGIGTNLWHYGSPIFTLFSAAGIIWLLYGLSRKINPYKSYIFLFSLILGCNLMYLGIGSAVRFLTLIIPWLALGIALLFTQLLTGNKNIKLLSTLLLIIFIGWELFFSLNTIFPYQHYGKKDLTYGGIRQDLYYWGYQEIDKFLDTLTRDKYPAINIPYKYAFLEEIKKSAVDQAKAENKQAAKILVIYDDSMFHLATLWTFDRRGLYQGWPMIPASAYALLTEGEKKSAFDALGFTDKYFIRATDNLLLNSSEQKIQAAENLETTLKQNKISPLILKNNRNKDIALIYHWSD